MMGSIARRGRRPAKEILWALRGTSYFLRVANALTDAEVDEPSPSFGQESRRQLMATVGYDARGFARLANEVTTGNPHPQTFASREERDNAISSGARLPAHALMHLLEHSAVHLRVEWRDLRDWTAVGRDHLGSPLALADTPWIRARAVWLGAIDLNAGGSFHDIPHDILIRLASECLVDAQAEGYRTKFATSESLTIVEWGADTVSGALADVVRWMLARGEQGVRVSSDPGRRTYAT